jgi:hypothetical protein
MSALDSLRRGLGWLGVVLGVISTLSLMVPTRGFTQPPKRVAAHIVFQGAVDVRTLPHPTAQSLSESLSASALPIRVPNAGLLRQAKLRMASGVSAGVATAPQALNASTVSLGASFGGLNFLLTGMGLAGFVPPDTQVAVGPNHIVEPLNAAAGIYSKSGTLLTLFSFYDFFGVSLSTQIVSDPRILYDQSSQRWFLSVVVLNANATAGGWRLAVSTSSDPTGTYYLYEINTTGSFPDFPKLGVCDDKVVLTGDAFNVNTFLGTEFLVANKKQIISGASRVSIKFFAPNQGMFAIEPAQSLPSLSPTKTEYMVAVLADPIKPSTAVRLWSVTGVPGVSTVKATYKDLDIKRAAA